MVARRVLVIGAGFGGLSAARELSICGIDVTVIESALAPGGKARTTALGDRSIDAGPTVLTMPWVWEGWGIEDLLEPLDLLARHAWSDGSTLDLFADRAQSADAIGRFAGAAEARRYLAFARDAQAIWETARGPFVLSQKPSALDIAKHTARHGLGALLRIDAHRTMAKALESAFVDPRLRQLFGRYATYCGGSPYETPATYNLVAHVESEGVSKVRGGMAGLARAMADRTGASFRYGARASRILIEKGRAVGVILDSGEELRADAVVMNGDASHLSAMGVTKSKPRPASERSLSAFTVAMAGKPSGFALATHNVFFSASPEREWSELRERAPSDPTVYVYTPDEETFLFVVNAPPTGDETEKWTENESHRCLRASLSTLSRSGLTIDASHVVTTTPADFAKRFPGTGGSLYGPAPRGLGAALSRPGARGPVPGLYLAGGSVHPGPGVPMATLSGRFAAETVRSDLLGSIVRSRPAAISGTTSTV